uniref:LBH domain-containing protein n=1 Tax=Eptatretus burgeri TaxID=7764 RepID=A0A8C4RE63_EPTBU
MTELIMGPTEDVRFKAREGRLLFQIFPDPYDPCDVCCVSTKVRLPSIVVEPMDAGDVESGELRWPPAEMLSESESITTRQSEEQGTHGKDSHYQEE